MSFEELNVPKNHIYLFKPHDRLVLSTGESVETLYYHECRMPDEVMTEMWIDFPSRRLRVKCGLHDALGWNSSLCGIASPTRPVVDD